VLATTFLRTTTRQVGVPLPLQANKLRMTCAERILVFLETRGKPFKEEGGRRPLLLFGIVVSRGMCG
jgi:hypothetical protein